MPVMSRGRGGGWRSIRGLKERAAGPEWPRRDSNPQPLRDMGLNHACLPVSPRGRFFPPPVLPVPPAPRGQLGRPRGPTVPFDLAMTVRTKEPGIFGPVVEPAPVGVIDVED